MSSTLHNRFVSVTINQNDDQDIIETKSVDETQDDNICTICYSSIEDNTKTTLKCGHMYHTDCYTTYIAYNIINKKETITCPVCRNDILEIVVSKPDVIHVFAGDADYDVESQSVNDDDDNTELSGVYMYGQCCGLLVLRLMMVGIIYLVLHFCVYCSYSDTC